MRANTIAFFLALSLFLISLIYFPHLNLFFFTPYLILTMYKKDFFALLVRALLCGTLIDLFSSHPFFGLSPLLFLFTSAVVYMARLNFFEDKLTTLPIMTFLFSLLYSLTELIFYPLFGGKVSFEIRWIFTDLFFMALCDALYALILFAIPFQITHNLSRIWRLRGRRR